MLAGFRIDQGECGHTRGISARRVRASLCGSAARAGGWGRVGCSCTATVAAPEVGVIARLLTLGILLGVGRRAVTLRAGRDTLVGVIYLVIAGTGYMVALGCAADICCIAYS